MLSLSVCLSIEYPPNCAEAFVSARGEQMKCFALCLSSLAHLVWLCCDVREDAAQPFNLITLQEKLQLNLVKNVFLGGEARILTDLCSEFLETLETHMPFTAFLYDFFAAEVTKTEF